MLKNVRHLIIITALLILFTSCGGGGGSGPGTVAINRIGETGMGYIEVILDYNESSDYEMGVLYGKTLIEKSPTIEFGYSQYIYSTFPDAAPVDPDDNIDLPEETSTLNYEICMSRVKKMRDNLPASQRDFLYGLASVFNGGDTDIKDDGKLSINETFYFSMLTSVIRSTQCTVVSAFGNHTTTGKSVIGRLVDWGGFETSSVFYIKRGGRSVMLIGSSLLDQSMVTGINRNGIFAAILDRPNGAAYPDLDTEKYYCYASDLRYAMENFNTIEEMASFLGSRKYTFSHLIALGDKDKVKVLENDLAGNRVLRSSDSTLKTGVTWEYNYALAVVNLFMLPGNYGEMTDLIKWDSIRNQIYSYLHSGDNRINMDDIKKITTYPGVGPDEFGFYTGGIMNYGTQIIAVFDTGNSTLNVFFRNKRIPGAENTQTTFNFSDPDFLSVPIKFD